MNYLNHCFLCLNHCSLIAQNTCGLGTLIIHKTFLLNQDFCFLKKNQYLYKITFIWYVLYIIKYCFINLLITVFTLQYSSICQYVIVLAHLKPSVTYYQTSDQQASDMPGHLNQFVQHTVARHVEFLQLQALIRHLIYLSDYRGTPTCYARFFVGLPNAGKLKIKINNRQSLLQNYFHQKQNLINHIDHGFGVDKVSKQYQQLVHMFP